MNEAKFSRLPKWAQNEIKSLSMKITELQKELDSFFSNESNVKYRGNDVRYRSLPEDCTVKFDLGEIELRCSVVDGELRIFGSDEIRIIPRAANSIYIR